MNFIKENIDLIIKIFSILIYLIPSIYFIVSFVKKRNKKKRLKIGHYLVTVILIFSLIMIKGEIKDMKNNIFINNSGDKPNEPTVDDKPVNNNVDKPNEPIKEDDHKNNPNYIGITPKGYTIEKKDGAYYVDNYLIVNKSYQLAENWVPVNTYEKIITDEICKLCINKNAYSNWTKMKVDAEAIGLNIYIASGYRSYSYQKGLYEKYVSRDGKVAADTYSARAGHSEHQSGLVFDLNSVDSSFAATNEGKWVGENAHLYGFIIRYPKDKTHETGYKYEPWHLRYVGLDLANKLYNDGDWISMESYFGIDSKYS